MREKKVYRAIGLMSGTSLDGVDAALLETDGRDFVRPIGFYTREYEPSERETVRAFFGQKQASGEVEELIADIHIEAIRALMAQQGVKAGDLDVIGFHGQTIYHNPAQKITVQVGDAARIAREIGVQVVADFRSADVKAGGQGAPLAPLYHAARVRSAELDLPVAVLNIGGVANVTWIGADGIVAFDTGPGNALMDDWIKKRTGAAFDKDGAAAAKGKAVEALLHEWLGNSYFVQKPPKSLDRDEWDIAVLGKLVNEMAGISTEDGAATLMKFTGETIVQSTAHMKQEPKRWYLCGGGRHNKALVDYLRGRLKGAVEGVGALGWNGDATEAECFGYLAVRSLLGEAISLPETTGVPGPLTGGVLFKS